jgi:hypothetical protein
MTDERALLAALREANPVPDPNALIENPGSTDRGAAPQRNHTMPSTQSAIDFEQRVTPPKRRRSLAMAAWAAVIVIVAAGAFALLRPGPGEVASPEEVAASYFEAINQNDPDGWWALHSEDAVIFGESLSEESVRQSHQDYFDWRTTTESRFENVECTETARPGADATGLVCAYEWRGAIQDRFGVVLSGYIQMDITDGKIVRVTTDSPDFDPMNGFPVRYLIENHGAEFASLCGEGPGAFNGGEDCALLYMDNLDAMAEAWEAEIG